MSRLRQPPPAVAAWVRPDSPATERPDLDRHAPTQGRARGVPAAYSPVMRVRRGVTTPLAKLKLGVEEQPLTSGTAVSFGAALQPHRTRLVALRGPHLDQLPQQSTSTRAREIPDWEDL
jgi:hypothetical protein